MIVRSTIKFGHGPIRYAIEVPEIDDKMLAEQAQELFGASPDASVKVAFLCECCTIRELAFGNSFKPADMQFKHILRYLELAVHEAIAKVYPSLVDEDGNMPWVKFSFGVSAANPIPPISKFKVDTKHQPAVA